MEAFLGLGMATPTKEGLNGLSLGKEGLRDYPKRSQLPRTKS